MTDKTILLTGATSGIGQAAAINLATQGYRLCLVARSETKAAATTQRIKAKTPDANIQWLYGDLSKQADVKAIAQAFLALNLPLDVLWLNAGLCYNKRVMSDDGYEMMWAVNHLAPFLLTALLFDKLTSGMGETRVVVTASGAYSFVDGINLEDVNSDTGFKTFEAYGNSKLANILFTRTLALKLTQAAPLKTFTVNCFHPGFVGTGIGTQALIGKVIMAVCKPFVRSSAKGAETGLFLAMDPSIEGQSTGYYYDCKVKKTARYARDDEAAERLWEVSEKMVRQA